VVTGSGELKKTNGVKKIFHAAVVTGQVGIGYTPIADVGKCVRNALNKADKFRTLKSILFPLLGTGTARANVRDNARQLIGEAIGHLRTHDACPIQRICFLAWSEAHLEVCRDILDRSGDVTFAGNTDLSEVKRAAR